MYKYIQNIKVGNFVDDKTRHGRTLASLQLILSLAHLNLVVLFRRRLISKHRIVLRVWQKTRPAMSHKVFHQSKSHCISNKRTRPKKVGQELQLPPLRNRTRPFPLPHHLLTLLRFLHRLRKVNPGHDMMLLRNDFASCVCYPAFN